MTLALAALLLSIIILIIASFMTWRRSKWPAARRSWIALNIAFILLILGSVTTTLRATLPDSRFFSSGIVELVAPAFSLFFLAGIWGLNRFFILRQNAIEEKNNLLQALFESTHDAIFVKNLRGRYVMINAAGAAVLGASPQEVIGKDDVELFSSSPQTARAIIENDRIIMAKGVPQSFEETLTAGQQTRIFLTTKAPYCDHHGKIIGLAVFSRDITERKRDEQAMRQTQKLESLGVLAGGIAHDFNNLLVGILGNAGLARLQLPDDSPLREIILHIEAAGHRAAELAQQMLAYSGKGRFVIERVDLNRVVEEMENLLEAAISKNVAVKYGLAARLPPIDCDLTQIRQVVMNLVMNASEAIGQQNGAITITTGSVCGEQAHLSESIVALEKVAEAYAYVEVSDTGCGMNEETRSRIFDPFFTTKFTGRGLGLAVVLGIVRGHKGAIKISSEPGHGTSFKALFPCAEMPPEVEGAQGRERFVR
jgi:PAS domain S-box-containing protein